MSDDVVRRHAACGTPAEVKAKLEDYRAIGLDEVMHGRHGRCGVHRAVLKAING